MKTLFIEICQILIHLTTSIPQRFLFKIKVNKKLNLKKGKYIIAANHPSKLDPFMLLAAIPFRTYLRLVPIRFITAEKYMDTWYKKIYMLPPGCVTTEPKNRKCLDVLKECLNNRETIFVFPRGQLERRGKSPAKVGVVYLEREVKDAKIIPVKISVSRPITVTDVLRRRVKVNFDFKDVFRHEKFGKDLQVLADDVMRRVEG